MNNKEGLSKDQIIDALNHSGYPFEMSIEDVVHQARDESGSPWQLMTRNYAVQFQGNQSEIDCILCNETGKTLLVVECKRAHPDYKAWVFFEDVRGATTANGRCIRCYAEDNHKRFQLVKCEFPDLISPLTRKAIEVRHGDGKKGGKKPYATEQIEQACLQVTIGSLALVEEYFLPYRQKPQAESIVPVVVTTAKLKKVILEDENGVVGISDGNINLSKAELKDIPWAYLQRSVPLPALVRCGSGDNYQTEQNSLKPFEENSIHVLIVNSNRFKEFLANSRGFELIPIQ
jgi:hypothetical protein